MSPADYLASHIASLRKQLAGLEMERAVLTRTIAELESVHKSMAANGQSTAPVLIEQTEATFVPANDSNAAKPAVAVRQYLADHPQGVVLKSLVDAMSDKITTTSSEPKRLLYNTVYNLQKRGVVERYTNAGGYECVRLTAKSPSMDSDVQ